MRKSLLFLAASSMTLAAALAACDNSSVSSPGGGFGFDGGSYQGPDGGSPPPPPPGSVDGGTPDAAGDAGGKGACTATLSGAITKTLSCTANGAYSAQDNKSGVSITVGQELNLAFTLDGELTTGTFGWAQTADQGGTIIENLTNVWLVSKTDAVGASEFVLTSAPVAFSTANGKTYDVRGAATATFKAQNDAGGGGDVTLSVTF